MLGVQLSQALLVPLLRLPLGKALFGLAWMAILGLSGGVENVIPDKITWDTRPCDVTVR